MKIEYIKFMKNKIIYNYHSNKKNKILINVLSINTINTNIINIILKVLLFLS